MHIQTYRGVDYTGSSYASLQFGNVLSRVYREDQGHFMTEVLGLLFVNRFGRWQERVYEYFVEIGRVFEA